MNKEGKNMFNPNDIFISIMGSTNKMIELCFNLELYNNFSFIDNFSSGIECVNSIRAAS